jgi:hypothetical protein
MRVKQLHMIQVSEGIPQVCSNTVPARILQIGYETPELNLHNVVIYKTRCIVSCYLSSWRKPSTGGVIHRGGKDDYGRPAGCRYLMLYRYYTWVQVPDTTPPLLLRGLYLEQLT